jgi:hypothetical protein
MKSFLGAIFRHPRETSCIDQNPFSSIGAGKIEIMRYT